MREEAKQVLIDSAVEEAKLSGVRGMFSHLSFICLMGFLILPPFVESYAFKLALVFALLSIAYRPVKA